MRRLLGTLVVSIALIFAPGFATPALASHGWSVVPTPSPGTQENSLEGVVAFSSTDAWAVGAAFDSALPEHTLALHWDGTH